jgi:hypothetical protein
LPCCFFGRTALVDDAKFWLWGIVDAGSILYVYVSEGRGIRLLGMGSGESVTPEEFIARLYERDWKRRARARSAPPPAPRRSGRPARTR